MGKIQRVSRVMKIIFWIGSIGIILFTIAGWLTGGELYNAIHFRLFVYVLKRPIASLPPIQMFYGFLITMLPTLTLSAFFYFAARLFGTYQTGDIFTAKNARYIMKISLTILTWVIILRPIYGLLITTLLGGSLQSFPWKAIIFDVAYFADFGVGILFLIVGWVMLEAAKLKEEQKLTI